MPEKIQKDAGEEFINKKFKKYLDEKNISMYISMVNSELKASVIERFNRTFKVKMWRNFTLEGKYIYYNVIDSLINAYNNSYHRTIKMKPSSVTKDKEQEIYDLVFTNTKTPAKKFKLKINDKVRISKYKTVLNKGYTPNWSEEIFFISDLIPRSPPVEGVFYETELQKIVKEDDVFKVEEILKRRIRNRKEEILVKWLGYPEKFNSWEPASSIIK